MILNRFKKKKEIEVEKDKLPQHIAFIMDGNGRWARRRGLPRTAGHHEGGKTLLEMIKVCNELGVKAITVYAFSTENWSRPKDEVNYLMDLPSQYINKYLPKIKEANIKMNFIGFIDQLPDKMKYDIEVAIEQTKHNTGMVFTIAINYGSQDELIHATKQIAQEVKDEKMSIEDITKDYFSSKLMTKGLPDVDLLIRTSGEIRISNFLLWQISYSELYFTNKYWPDFNEKELKKAIIDYQSRNRRFGGLKGEIK